MYLLGMVTNWYTRSDHQDYVKCICLLPIVSGKSGVGNKCNIDNIRLITNILSVTTDIETQTRDIGTNLNTFYWKSIDFCKTYSILHGFVLKCKEYHEYAVQEISVENFSVFFYYPKYLALNSKVKNWTISLSLFTIFGKDLNKKKTKTLCVNWMKMIM